MALPTATGRLEAGDDTSLQFAMLSIYHRSVARELEVRGAPAVLLSPEVRPLGLAEALDFIVREYPQRRQEAVWRVVRGVPVARLEDRLERRYPRALIELLDPGELAELDRLRRSYRLGANLFAAALVACTDGRQDEFDELRRLMGDRARGAGDVGAFSRAAERVFGRTAPDYLGIMSSGSRWESTARQVARLEGEVGLDLYDFVEELADALAFMDSLGETSRPSEEHAGATVYPVSTVIRQDSSTLTTTATATTLVQSDFDSLRRAVDPLCWHLSSDVIKSTGYVGGPFALDPLPSADLPAVGAGWDGPARYLKERAEVSWGLDTNRHGSFDNVLKVRYSVSHDSRRADLDFSLGRSIASRVLWDQRAGGMLVNAGYVKVRPLGVENRWRLTRRKVLRFSDRTPYAGGPGWFDFGQMLNHLAPAGLAWWLEGDLYGSQRAIFADAAEVEAQLHPAVEGRT